MSRPGNHTDPAAPRPPRLARALLRLLLPRDERDGAIDALDEKFRDYARSPFGVRRAGRWYWRQATGALHPRVWRNNESPNNERELTMTNWMQDVRFGLRMLARTPGVTAVILITLAVGMGFNGAIFSLLNTIVLNDIPVEQPADILFASGSNFSQNQDFIRISYPDFQYFRATSRSFDSLAAYAGVSMTITDRAGTPERLVGTRVTPSMFDVLRIEPALGRRFEPTDAEPEAEAVTLLGHGTWQNRYGADPAVLGRTIQINGTPATIVGVLPAVLEQTPFGPDIWAPLVRTEERESNRDQRFYTVVGRLNDGADRLTADNELKQLAAALEAEHPESNEGVSVRVETYADYFGDTGNVTIAWIMMGAVGFLLLIACANVANLLISRSVKRGREIVIRSALGASRWRVVRQLLIESLLLSLIGGVAASAIAYAGANALHAAVAHADPPIWWDFSVRPTVYAYIAILSVGTSVIFGLVPALHTTRGSVSEGLKDGGRTSSASGTRRLTGTLVVVQLALALVLLAGAGVMIHSTMNILDVEWAIAPDDVLTMRLSLTEDGYPDRANIIVFHDELDVRLRSLPSVQSVALASRFPSDGGFDVAAEIEGFEVADGNAVHTLQQVIVSPSYFEMADVRPIRGRLFDNTDGLEGDPVVVVEQRLAGTFWPDEDPIGKRLRWVGETETRWMRVIGVIPDIKQSLPVDVMDDNDPVVYTPYKLEPLRGMGLMVKSSMDPEALSAALRREVQRADANLPLFNIMPLQHVIDERTIGWRIISTLFVLLGTMALFLSCLGIYSVMAFAVGSRRQEIGIRMALGAPSGGVLKLVARGALVQTILGLGLGLLAAFGTTRVLGMFMYEVSPNDPMTFAVAIVLLLATAIVACIVPARRAAGVDPLVALRPE